MPAHLTRRAPVLSLALAVSLSGGSTDLDIIAAILGSLDYFNGAGLCAVYLPLVRR